MLYELIAVVRPGNLAEVKEIARTAGSLILRSGGTIRGLHNWGVFNLPKKTRKHQAQYTNGHYFVMRFDASSKIQDDVRTTSVKLGDGTLESLSRISGNVEWKNREEF
ncbi:37S ribosomal protein MRP17, mitochondrial [Lachnellula subtilissima]|uniref:37S ribosomal protein MRP17, mitochondrial n=1 Tax=Lachnellula subtilissima TaxID=602034 RepID=A0A8H8RZU3_9HELO|nr:37S ribosomal protein MRP17, mitochondrial [Lachnellula subtilissima]